MCYYICGQCSTSCGLGAIWRTLACSTGSDSGCDPAKRPAPAQRCYLRPCSTWKLEEWSEVRLLVYTYLYPVLFIYFVYMHSKRYLLRSVGIAMLVALTLQVQAKLSQKLSKGFPKTVANTFMIHRE